jgi:hypothetical protein
MTEEKNCLFLRYETTSEDRIYIKKSYALNEIETKKFHLSPINVIDVTDDAPNDFIDDDYFFKCLKAKLCFIEPITKTFYNEIQRLELVDYDYYLHEHNEEDKPSDRF